MLQLKLKSVINYFIFLTSLICLCLLPFKSAALKKENQKVAVVTGASRGIGKALIEELLNEQIKVIAIVRNEKSLTVLIQKYPNQLQVIEADLSTPKGQNNIVGNIEEPEVHYLVHGAGVIEPLGSNALLEAKPEILRNILEVNVMAPIMLTNALGGKLKTGSRVLNISSVAGDKATLGLGAYCISKVALDRFSESLQLDHPHEILATSVHPGRVDTDMQADLRNHKSADFLSEKYVKYKIENKLISSQKTAKYLKWLLVDSTKEQYLKKKHNIDEELHLFSNI